MPPEPSYRLFRVLSGIARTSSGLGLAAPAGASRVADIGPPYGDCHPWRCGPGLVTLGLKISVDPKGLAVPGTVVCGVNESAGAREAAQIVAALGKQLDFRVVLVHVVDGTTSSDAGEHDEDKPTREARTGGKRFLDRFSDDYNLEAAERRIETGDPAERLAEVAAEERAALIVVGSRARKRRWRPRLRSDVSRDLMRVTTCPVLAVPPRARDYSSQEPVTLVGG